MKTIKFRPLRRLKNTGKIVVASYTTWNSVRCADYNKFNLIVDNEYRNMPSGEFVYNSDGELLFFYQYSPNNIPIFNYPFSMDVSEIHALTSVRGLNWGESISYSGIGIDCCGTPTFSHYTADKIADHFCNTINEFEPLTVGKVIEWYAWWLFLLKNASIKAVDAAK